MSLDEVLSEHEAAAQGAVDRSKKQLAAAQKLLHALQAGNMRDIDKLRGALSERVADSRQAAGELRPIEFDTEAYLADGGQFLAELEEAARRAGVRLFVRDGIAFSYPVLLRTEPQERTVRIDKARTASLSPSALVRHLKALQEKEAKAKPERLLRLLKTAYPYAAAKRGLPIGQDVPLREIYDVMTLGPDGKRDYSLLDFTRDIYLLDISGVDQVDGQRLSFSASTATREARGSVLRFVDRDGHEKLYSRIRFTPVSADSDAAPNGRQLAMGAE